MDSSFLRLISVHFLASFTVRPINNWRLNLMEPHEINTRLETALRSVGSKLAELAPIDAIAKNLVTHCIAYGEENGHSSAIIADAIMYMAEHLGGTKLMAACVYYSFAASSTDFKI